MSKDNEPRAKTARSAKAAATKDAGMLDDYEAPNEDEPVAGRLDDTPTIDWEVAAHHDTVVGPYNEVTSPDLTEKSGQSVSTVDNLTGEGKTEEQ